MITVLLQIDNSVYQYWPDHMISVSYWLTLLPWNFVYLENQYDNCKRSLITKNKLDSQKSSSHGIVNYSFVSMGENSTVRLWRIFIFHFYIVLIFLSKLSAAQTYHFSLFWYQLYKTAKIFKKHLDLYIWKHFITQVVSHNNLLGQWDCESVRQLMECSCVIFLIFWEGRDEVRCEEWYFCSDRANDVM